jgi:hypothetical protein
MTLGVILGFGFSFLEGKLLSQPYFSENCW